MLSLQLANQLVFLCWLKMLRRLRRSFKTSFYTVKFLSIKPNPFFLISALILSQIRRAFTVFLTKQLAKNTIPK